MTHSGNFLTLLDNKNLEETRMIAPMLRVKNLKKSFGRLAAVDDVTLEFGHNELVAIIGPNGAGKSTFFNLITGLLHPDSGEIYFEGDRIDGLEPFKICRLGISLSFQIANLFHEFTSFENVRSAVSASLQKYSNLFTPIGKIKELHGRTGQIMGEVGLSNTLFPCKFLPHAEKKLTDLAISLGTKPKLLLLDEPTAGMGSEEVKIVTHLIKRILNEMNVAIIFTEHDLEVVFGTASRIIVMNRGKVIKDADPSEVRQDEQVRQLYGF